MCFRIPKHCNIDIDPSILSEFPLLKSNLSTLSLFPFPRSSTLFLSHSKFPFPTLIFTSLRTTQHFNNHNHSSSKPNLSAPWLTKTPSSDNDPKRVTKSTTKDSFSNVADKRHFRAHSTPLLCSNGMSQHLELEDRWSIEDHNQIDNISEFNEREDEDSDDFDNDDGFDDMEDSDWKDDEDSEFSK